MSWIRIDENTYIDDSLVTCAEYQLFIDEMRIKGEYYQPDHWPGPRFPKGDARKPVLGVRPSDATLFCRWLARNQGTSEWSYRLPSLTESLSYHLNIKTPNLTGYWVEDKGEFRFEWVGSHPEDPWGILQLKENILSSILQYLPAGSEHLSRTINDIQEEVDDVIAEIIAGNSYISMDGAFNKEWEKVISALDKELADNLARKIAGYYSYGFRFVQQDNAIKEYVRLRTMQARIAGTSPAFEGIRLVRERIK